MQHDDKLGTMKLIMLSSEGGYHETNILILILVFPLCISSFLKESCCSEAATGKERKIKKITPRTSIYKAFALSNEGCSDSFFLRLSTVERIKQLAFKGWLP
jgi:hypothetical protein